jgi:DNA-binding IscR family transcriptional regulator
MLEKSETKRQVIRVLMDWNHAAEKATAFNIAKKINASESNVFLVLRVMKDLELVKSSRGSWVLV